MTKNLLFLQRTLALSLTILCLSLIQCCAETTNESGVKPITVKLNMPTVNGSHEGTFYSSLSFDLEHIYYAVSIFNRQAKTVTADIFAYNISSKITEKMFSLQLNQKVEKLERVNGDIFRLFLDSNILTPSLQRDYSLSEKKLTEQSVVDIAEGYITHASVVVGESVYELLDKEGENSPGLFLATRHITSREPKIFKKINGVRSNLLDGDRGNNNVYLRRSYPRKRVVKFHKVVKKGNSAQLKKFFEVSFDRFNFGSFTDDNGYIYKNKYYFDVSNFAKGTSKLTVLNPKTGKYTRIRKVKDATNDRIFFMNDAMFIREDLVGRSNGDRLVGVSYKRPFKQTVILEGQLDILAFDEDILALRDRGNFQRVIKDIPAERKLFIIKLLGD